MTQQLQNRPIRLPEIPAEIAFWGLVFLAAFFFFGFLALAVDRWHGKRLGRMLRGW